MTNIEHTGLKGKDISSSTYPNVITQFLAKTFYCPIGIYAESMFYQSIISLGQLEAEIMTDFVFYPKVVCLFLALWSYQKVVCH